MTVSAVQQVNPKHTIHSLLLSVVQKYRKVMLRQSVRSRDYSVVRKLPISSKNVTILVQAVCL